MFYVSKKDGGGSWWGGGVDNLCMCIDVYIQYLSV